MKEINQVVVSGRLTRDAELKYSQQGTAVLHLSIAHNEWYKGEEKAHFFDGVMFGEYAEKIAPKLTKGAQVWVAARLQQNRWESNGEKRSKVELMIREVGIYGDHGQNRKEDTTESNDEIYNVRDVYDDERRRRRR